LPPVGKVAPLTPALEGTDLNAYRDRAHKDSTVPKVVRAAQVALWACSHEPAPVPLQIEVAAARKKGRIDPDVLKLRYPIPPANAKAEARFKDDVTETAKAMTRLTACLEEALDDLKQIEGD